MGPWCSCKLMSSQNKASHDPAHEQNKFSRHKNYKLSKLRRFNFVLSVKKKMHSQIIEKQQQPLFILEKLKTVVSDRHRKFFFFKCQTKKSFYFLTSDVAVVSNTERS